MKWKALLAITIILGILGTLFITDVGKRYADFLRIRIGDFLAILTRKGPSGPPFRMVLTTRKEPFYGQSFNIVNSSFSGSGFHRYIKVGEQVISIKSGEKVRINVRNLNGVFAYTNEGNIRLTGDSSQIEIDDFTFSSETASKVEIEIVPFEFSLTGIEQDSISLLLVSGNVKTDRGDAPLENSKLDISFFTGNLNIAEDGTAILTGMASSVSGSNFSFK